MTQEDKELLLQDLCARLPYYTMVLMGDGAIKPLINVNVDTYICNGLKGLPKPYLRPLSSMTEDEEREYNGALTPLGDFMFEQEELFRPIQLYKKIPFGLYEFFNSHHFDYRGLIPKGLAIEVTKENNPYK